MPAKIEPAKYRNITTKAVVKVTGTDVMRWRTRDNGVYIDCTLPFVQYERNGVQYSKPEYVFRATYARV